MRAVPYINFNGNCEQAIHFYQRALGGDVELMRFDAIPEDEGIPMSDAWKQKIMHGSLTLAGGVVLYFSDSWEEAPVDVGSHATIHLEVDSEPDVARMTEALSAGGEVIMGPEKTFWGSTFGGLVDKYGVQWSIEFAEA